MNIDQEIDIFAEELYKYLLPRRIGIYDTRFIKHRNPTDVNHFTDDVGKAVLMACYYYQERFWKTFIKDYPDFLKDLHSFMTYCAGKAFTIHDEMGAMHIDVFNSLFMVGAMILELVTFCHFQNFEHFKWYAYICWTEIFKSLFKDKFFENGGWQTQRERAQEDAKSYDNNKHEFHIVPGKFSIPHQWLIDVDPKFIVTEPPLESILRSLCFQNMHQTFISTDSNDITSVENLYTMNELKGHSLQEKFKHNCSKMQISTELIEELDTSKMEEVLDLSTVNKLLTETKSQKQLGAIPKTTVKSSKDCKTVLKVASISNEDILKSFMNIILCEDDEDGRYLKHVLRFNKNMQHLINDRHYFRLIKETVENSAGKPNTKKLLEEAIPIICKSCPPSEGEKLLSLSCKNNFEKRVQFKEGTEDNQQDPLYKKCKIHAYVGKVLRKKASTRTLNTTDKLFEIAKANSKIEKSCSESMQHHTDKIIRDPNHINEIIQHLNNKFGNVIIKMDKVEIGKLVLKDKKQAKRIMIECLDLNCSVTERIISLRQQINSHFSKMLKFDDLEDMITNWKEARSSLTENESDFDLDEAEETIKGLIVLNADLVLNADKIEEKLSQPPKLPKILIKRGGKVQDKATS